MLLLQKAIRFRNLICKLQLTAEELEALDLKGKDIGETISKLIERRGFLESSLEKMRTAVPAEFIYTEPLHKKLKERVIAMLDIAKPNDVIRIMGYFGSPLLDKFYSILEKGCQLRLITRKELDKESEDATIRIAKLNPEFVRVHKTAQGRLLVVGNKEAVISSADLKSDSLDINYEAGICTNNPVVIEDVIRFFDKIWDEAGRWSG
jgi:hypothetical protein